MAALKHLLQQHLKVGRTAPGAPSFVLNYGKSRVGVNGVCPAQPEAAKADLA